MSIPGRTVLRCIRHGILAALAVVAIQIGPCFVLGASPVWLDLRELVGIAALVAVPIATVAAMRATRRHDAIRSASALFSAGAVVAMTAALVAASLTIAALLLAGDALPQAILAHHLDALRAEGGAGAHDELQALAALAPRLADPRPAAMLVAVPTLLAGLLAAAIGARRLRAR